MKPKINSKENSNLINTLSKLLTELKDAVSGHVIAYQQLVSKENIHKIETLYSIEAENEWGKILKREPNDWIALHHLAILCHTRAFELEIDDKNDQAVEYWKKAYKYWYELFKLNEPIDRFHDLLKNLERYNENEQKQKFTQLKQNIINDLLKIHYKLYNYYSNQKEKAQYHYQILEKSPFKESIEIIQLIYKNNFGDKVSDISSRFEDLNSPDKKIKLENEIDKYLHEISKLYQEKPSLVFALRDTIILQALKIRIFLAKWLQDLHNLLDEMKNDEKKIIKLEAELNELKTLLENLDKKLDRGDYNLIDKRNSIANGFNQKLNEIRSASEKMDKKKIQHLRKLLNISNLISEGNKSYEQLTPVCDYESALLSNMAFKKALNELIILETQIQGIETFEEYRKIKNLCVSSVSILDGFNMNITKPPDEKREEIETKIWNWTEFKHEEIPYYNTAFLLFEAEFPSVFKQLNMQSLINDIKLNIQKILINKAKAGKHFVLGRKIKHEDLNTALKRLDSPVELCKDMLLQHQAHHADTENIKDVLKKIDLPLPEESLIEFSGNIFSYFPLPDLSEDQKKKWEKPKTEKFNKNIKPNIIWPL